MDFILVFKFLLNAFEREKIDFALIGGFALQALGVVRTTLDIDLIVKQEDAEKIKSIMCGHGYDLIHEREDVLNFTGRKFELGRVDFLQAHRKYALSMLENAEEKELLDGQFKIRVIRKEDLIGLKVQSSSNDPGRFNQDMADIRAMIAERSEKLDMDLVREYFCLFDRENELDEMIDEITQAE